jgi:hypothetical protein
MGKALSRQAGYTPITIWNCLYPGHSSNNDELRVLHKRRGLVSSKIEQKGDEATSISYIFNISLSEWNIYSLLNKVQAKHLWLLGQGFVLNRNINMNILPGASTSKQECELYICTRCRFSQTELSINRQQ